MAMLIIYMYIKDRDLIGYFYNVPQVQHLIITPVGTHYTKNMLKWNNYKRSIFFVGQGKSR